MDLMSSTSILDSENVPLETGVCYNTVFFLWPRNQFHLLYHSIDNMSVALTRFLTNQNARKTVLGEDLKTWEIMLEFTSHALPQFLPQKMIDLVKNYQKAAFFQIIWSQSYCHRAIISIFGYFCLLVYLEPFLWML